MFIADMLSNKKLQLTVAELFIRSKKINMSLAFIAQSYFAVPKYTHYIITKSLSKGEFQHQILTLNTL